MAIYIFYDSSSKMYLIYTTLCYAIIILYFTASEALRAPIQYNDGLNRGRKVVIRDKDRQLRGSYHVGSTKDESIELIVEDLVEKVKDRLKSELKIITAPDGSKAKPQIEEDINPHEELAAQRKQKLKEAKLLQDKLIKPTYIPISELEGGYQPTEEPARQNIKPENGIPKIKRKRTTPDKRYIAEVFTAKPPKYLFEYGPPKLLKNPTELDTKEIKKIETTYTTEDIETESTPLTTESSGAFVGFDLLNTNDSYEDYVTPKRDTDYKEPESQTLRYAIANKGRQNKLKNRQKMVNDFETANQAMSKTKNRGNYDNANYEQTMLGDYNRANKVVEPEDQEYETTEDKLPTKNKQKSFDDINRAKQLMSKIKHLNEKNGEENKNSEIFTHEAVRDFDKLNKAVSNIKRPKDYKINKERAKEILDNMDIGTKSYPEQLNYVQNDADNSKITMNNKNVNLFENVKISNKNEYYEDDDNSRQIENRGIRKAVPILRARKNVDVLFDETQPVILKRRKSFVTFNETDSDTNETFDNDDLEAITLKKLIQRILGNVPMKKTKIYLLNLT